MNDDSNFDDLVAFLTDAPDVAPSADDEALYQQALAWIRETGSYTTAKLQKHLNIGYSKAGRITDLLEERGVLLPATPQGYSINPDAL
jgi:S-DNA-T family DNA segregation ATPase FtsK/SpoIIIE